MTDYPEVAVIYDWTASNHQAKAEDLERRAFRAEQDGDHQAAEKLRADGARQRGYARNEQDKADRLRGGNSRNEILLSRAARHPSNMV